MSATPPSQSSERTTHHVYHDWQRDESLSETIVSAVAAYENTRPEELPPLSRSINPTALEHIFEDTTDDSNVAGSLTFTYFDYVVLVMSTGQILLRKPEGR